MGKMKRGRAAARGRRKAMIAALVLAVISAAVVPAAPGSAGEARAQSGSGTIVHSADGVLLRAEPAYGAEVLSTMAEGSTVGLRTGAADTVYDPDGVTQWWPIQAGDVDGWVAGFYLDIDAYPAAPAAAGAADAPADELSLGGEGASAPAEEQFLATWDLTNAAAMVAEPDGVNVRQDPGSESPVVKALSFQTVVDLRVDELDTVYSEGSRWWPVRIDGLIGWVAGQYLAPAESWAAPEAAADADIPSKIGDVFAAGSYVLADTDDGSGINIRADGAPDAERIGIVPENDVVQVMDGPYQDPIGNPWYLITDGDVTGFVAGWYLQRADQPGEDLANAEIPSKVNVPGLATGFFEYPLQSWTFTQSFGCSPYWFEPWDSSVGCNYHNGIDLAAPAYTPLLAADGGTVEYAGWCDCGLGYYVKIDHGNGFKTLYGHMAEPPWVAAGESVSKGEVIGPVGSSGISTGPHVHFIMELNGVAQDPLGYLPA
jgi:murein DD-endopeptidase MepM/ murein hydrolase activator NlpD